MTLKKFISMNEKQITYEKGVNKEIEVVEKYLGVIKPMDHISPKIEDADGSASCPAPGKRIRSRKRGRGLARGKGKGPIGVPVGEEDNFDKAKKIAEEVIEGKKELKEAFKELPKHKHDDVLRHMREKKKEKSEAFEKVQSSTKLDELEGERILEANEQGQKKVSKFPKLVGTNANTEYRGNISYRK